MNYSCELCNTTYKTNKTLLNHNNKFHTNDTKIIFKCPHCDSKFTRKNNMVNHIKIKCKNKKEIDHKTLIEMQLIEMQKKIEVLENNNKVQSKTNINNGIINNGTINNVIYINKTGTENLLELTEQETKEIFSKEITGVVSLIKFINFNERLPSNHSFCTKSLEGKYLLKYNTEESKIESTRKKYFYHELLSTAVDKMELLYKVCKNKFSKDKQQKIEDTIIRLKDIKDRDFSDKILKEIQNQLIQLSYNCRNIVLNTWENNKTEGNNEIIDDLFIGLETNDVSDDDSESDDEPIILKRTKKAIVI